MSSAFRRFEILLPLKFNDRNPVPDKLIGDTLIELRERFDAASWETQTIRGTWVHETDVYHDEHTRVFVDVQLDIWMTTYPIEVL